MEQRLGKSYVTKGKYSPGEYLYTEWKQWFAWRPVKCLDNKTVWLQIIYKRQREVEWQPPAHPYGVSVTEYSTWESIMENKFK